MTRSLVVNPLRRIAGATAGVGATMLVAWLWVDEWLLMAGPWMEDWFHGLPLWLVMGVRHILWAYYVGFAVCLIWGFRSGRKDLVWAAVIYLLAQLLISFLVVRSLKIYFGRPRPAVGEMPWRLLTLEPDYHSLPSGHSADALVGFTVTRRFFFSAWARGGAWAVTLLAMAGRMVQHQHYLSDVALGAWLGYVGSLAVMWVVERFLARRPLAGVGRTFAG